MKTANFKFDFYGCLSFAFQHNYTKPYITYNKTLKVTFPQGEVLTFKEAESNFITQLSSPGNLGDFSSEVLADLDELGYNLEQGVAVVMIDLETLKNDLLLNPGMFTRDGEAIPYPWEGFPDGVYEIFYSYNEKPASYSTKTTSIDPNLILEPYVGTIHRMKMCGALSCRATLIELYLEQGCATPTDCMKGKAMSDVVTRMRMLELGATYDFSVKDYVEATKKIEAMTTLCRTGNCNYNKGC